MSGVVAVVSRDPATLSRGPAMLRRLAHLPQYEVRTVASDSAWLGACGWPAAIDSAREQSPSGSVTAVVSGEFLNAAELRRTLRVDCEAGSAGLALAAYRHWGPGLFAHLEGVYGVVLHDAGERLTIAGVDPGNVAVLHAVELSGDVLISSECKAFLCDPRFTPRLDERTFATLLALDSMVDGRTLFSGVQGLGLGRHFEISDEQLSTARHWDMRECAGGSLRGEDYLEHLTTTMRELSDPLFSGRRLLLPLTGGVDSRLLAAVAPDEADVVALTFGSPHSPDVRRAAQMSRARHLRHIVLGLEEDYLARYGDGTVWLTEGRHNPVTNFSGGQMEKLADYTFHVSGHFGELGRSTLRGSLLIPDWALLRAGELEFEQRFLRDMVKPHLSLDWWTALFGARGRELFQFALDEVARKLAETRGLPVPDRLDIMMIELRFHACRAGMLYSTFWVDGRAPYLSRRWIQAVFSGAADERVDDSVRLRLIRRLSEPVAHVPWVRTRLPLPISDVGVRAVRQASRLRRAAPVDVPLTAFTSARATETDGLGRRLLDRAKRAIYDPGERREHWLRTGGRSYAEAVLLSERLAEHGVVDPAGVGALLDEQMSGHDHALALGHLMGLETWQRLFIDREQIVGTAPVMAVGGAPERLSAEAATTP